MQSVENETLMPLINSEMIDIALEYVDRGFSVIPVKRSDKRPYIPWKEFQARHPTETEILYWWSTWPSANIAIVTGSISKIFVIDADGPEGIRWINENLPKTGVYSITGKGVHAIFSIPPGVIIKNSVRLAPEVDVRGEGGYFVAPPSIHQNGHKYEWQFIMDGWDDLVEYQPVETRKTGNLNLYLSGANSKFNAEDVVKGVPQGNRDNMLFKEACRLRSKNLSADEAWVILKEFASRCVPPFSESEAQEKLKSAWKYEPGTMEESNFDCYVSDDSPSMVENTQEEIPSEIINPGGLLQKIMDYIDLNSPVSVPLYAVAAATTLVGAVAGQKVKTHTGLRTNIYSIALGYSGAGKNAPFGTIPQLLIKTSSKSVLGPTELTSSVSILRWLSIQGQQRCLMMLDEIGSVLKGLQNPNSPASDIPRMLTKLFSATDRPETKSYANGEQITVPWQSLCIYGASTPDRFWESLSPGEVLDGFLARVLIWESRHDAPFPKDDMQFTSNPDIINSIEKINSIQTESSGGNLENVPNPKTIPFTEEAKVVFREFAKSYHFLKNKHKDQGYAAVYGRAAEHAYKLALIHSISLHLDKISVVDLESVKWAISTITYLTNNTVKQINENIACNNIHRKMQNVYKSITIFDQQGKKATLRELQRGPCQGMLKKEMLDILESLIISEKIVVLEDKAKNGKVVKTYHAKK